jgi:hypothetical protein
MGPKRFEERHQGPCIYLICEADHARARDDQDLRACVALSLPRWWLLETSPPLDTLEPSFQGGGRGLAANLNGGERSELPNSGSPTTDNRYQITVICYPGIGDR